MLLTTEHNGPLHVSGSPHPKDRSPRQRFACLSPCLGPKPVPQFQRTARFLATRHQELLSIPDWTICLFATFAQTAPPATTSRTTYEERHTKMSSSGAICPKSERGAIGCSPSPGPAAQGPRPLKRGCLSLLKSA